MCFALHALASSRFFLQILNESCDLSYIDVVKLISFFVCR